MESARLRKFRRSGVVVMLSALCVLLGTATTSLAAGPPGHAHPAHPVRPVSRPPDGMSWRTYRLMLAQQPLDAAATRIQALAARPGPAHAGFFETKVDATKGVLTVYWHGVVPDSMQRLINGLRARVDIHVIHTRYSLAALNRAMLAAIHTYPSVTGGYPTTDGSGIVVGVSPGSPRSAASIAKVLRSRLGVPVAAFANSRGQLQYCAPYSSDVLNPPARCNDLAPFWGGNVIQSNYVYCSSAFGAHDRSGKQYLVTAAHCADNGTGYSNGITFRNGQDPAHWHVIGNITFVPGPHDAAAIPSSTGPRYYDGPGIYSGDTHTTKLVSGEQAVSVGDQLCESGAFGGVICGFTVRQLNYTQRDPNYGTPTWNSLAIASSASGRFTISGDSGGPWFSLNGCCTHVWAKGVHHGLLFGSLGTFEVFTPITVLTSDVGLSVNTG